jgi:phosphatidylglycerol:prolipoprotein diacylglycerol transferase
MEDCGAQFWQPYCYQLANPVWPTAFYEVVMCLLIFSFLWAIRKQIRVPGILFCIYLGLNGIERFFIEKIRINTEYNILGGITQAEIISFCLVLIGLLGCIILYRNNKKAIQ